MRLSSSVGAQGSRFTASGEGFTANSTVVLSMGSARLGSTTADSSGAWSLGASIPDNAAVGQTTVSATDGVSTLSAPFEVRAAGASRSASEQRSVAGVALPRTGAATAGLVAVALALIAVGTLAIVSARRRFVTAG